MRLSLKRIRSFLSCNAGVAAIEFALAAPVMLIMAAGVYEFGSAFAAQGAVNKLASQYAGAWADCMDSATSPFTCFSELANYLPTSNASYLITNIAPQLNSATNVNGLDIRMIWVTMGGTAGNLTATIKYGREIQFPSTYVSINPGDSPKPAELTIAQNTFTVPGQQGVIVTVKYNYNVITFPKFLYIPSNTITMTNMVPQLTNNS